MLALDGRAVLAVTMRRSLLVSGPHSFTLALPIMLLACAGPAAAPPPLVAPILLPSAASTPAVPVRHSVGERCAGDGALVCTEPGAALLCRNGSLAAMPCRGPKGCVDSGDNSICDDSLLDDGDVCRDRGSPDDYACSSDHTKGIICDRGIARVVRTCRGPKQCTVQDEKSRCDDSFAEAGDPCSPKPGDANYACGIDGTMQLVCDSDTRRFRVFTACRGFLHCGFQDHYMSCKKEQCEFEDHHMSCDQSVARDGEPCSPVDNVSCSEDATLELKCSAQWRWITKRACSKHPCVVDHSEVYCDQPVPARAPRRDTRRK